jgi:hypothetical protein
MDAITSHLRDPGWWFSAFFVAIIASVIAGFLKDRIERLLPNLSSRFSVWRAARATARAALIELLSDNHSLLTIAYFRAVVGLVLYVMTLLLFFMTPIFDELLSNSGTVLGIDRKFILSNILFPFVGVLAIVQGFRAAARLSLVGKAWREFSRKNNVPRMP